MHALNAFWSGVASLSGRLDLSDLTPPITTRQLKRKGLSRRHQAVFNRQVPATSPQPFVSFDSADFPDQLRSLPYSPGLLFFMGNLALLREPCVALVGARRCTGRGHRMANELAKGLTEAGAVTVSGLAYGIDHAVHMAAPDRTVAVLGQGLASAMKGSKRKAIGCIVEAGGLVLSEFLPNCPASKWTFPQRNRVVAGLALGTVVVEAGERSGSLITARHALNHGREVMVVPGHPLDGSNAGCNRLLVDGATPVRHTGDVCGVLNLTPRTKSPLRHPCADKRAILRALDTGDSADHIARCTGLPIPTVSAHLAELELTDWVVRLPGHRVSLRR